jgi:hypothetical protein
MMPLPVVEQHHQSILMDLVMILREQPCELGLLKVVNEPFLIPTWASMASPRHASVERDYRRYMLYGCDIVLQPIIDSIGVKEVVEFLRSRRVSLSPLEDNFDFHVHFFHDHGRLSFSDEFITYHYVPDQREKVSNRVAEVVAQFLLFGRVPMIT